MSDPGHSLHETYAHFQSLCFSWWPLVQKQAWALDDLHFCTMRHAHSTSPLMSVANFPQGDVSFNSNGSRTDNVILLQQYMTKGKWKCTTGSDL